MEQTELMSLRSVSVFAAAWLLSACGGREVTETTDASAQTVDGQVNTKGSSACPSAKPRTGAACTGAAVCEYGDDPRLACDALITCAAGTWTMTQVPATTGCSTTNSPACPAAFDGATPGASGCVPNLSCYYPEARCYCGAMVPGTPVGWLCDTGTNITMNASAFESCPLPRPRIGTACTEVDLTCEYGRCQGEDDVLACTNGAWEIGPAPTGGCPL
jgi:hypothetical protein